MDTKDYKEVPYTIEIDWNGGNVWLNNHVTKEKSVITPKTFERLESDFQLLDCRKKGLL